uniref:Uncharacterized protein n=1 Tax=Ananas comosus var. bracteatus TaxID=296719 RepID=A0A6V7Q039_ANACO|nr:unnamed protein product [Ananas comosus var. bracteatus]
MPSSSTPTASAAHPANLGDSSTSIVVLAHNQLGGCIPPSIGCMADTLNEIVLLDDGLAACVRPRSASSTASPSSTSASTSSRGPPVLPLRRRRPPVARRRAQPPYGRSPGGRLRAALFPVATPSIEFADEEDE